MNQFTLSLFAVCAIKHIVLLKNLSECLKARHLNFLLDTIINNTSLYFRNLFCRDYQYIFSRFFILFCMN